MNNSKLNYDYGDNVDSIFINNFSNSKIKFNMSENDINAVLRNNKENNELLNNINNKIKNIKYENLSYRSNYSSNNTKSYHSLYNEFKKKYNNGENNILENDKYDNINQHSNYKNYINASIQRNYLTLEPKNNKTDTYNIIENEIKSPLRNEYENKQKNNINLNFTEYKISSYTPNRYFSLNNSKSDYNIHAPNIEEKIIYYENKLAEQEKIKNRYEKEINFYKEEINKYKNSFQTITNFFEFISKNYIPDFYHKNKIFQINNESILYIYFKNLEEYIINLNKEMNDYKFKYQKLLDIDSSRRSISTKNTINKNKQINENNENILNNEKNENKIQNNSFSDVCNILGNNIENTSEKNSENFQKNNNYNSIYSDNDLDKYKDLEQRIILIEKELLLKKNKEKNSDISAESGHKISISKKNKKIINEENKNNNFLSDEKCKQKNNYLNHFIKNKRFDNNNNIKAKAIIKKKIHKNEKNKKKKKD